MLMLKQATEISLLVSCSPSPVFPSVYTVIPVLHPAALSLIMAVIPSSNLFVHSSNARVDTVSVFILADILRKESYILKMSSLVPHSTEQHVSVEESKSIIVIYMSCSLQ